MSDHTSDLAPERASDRDAQRPSRADQRRTIAALIRPDARRWVGAGAIILAAESGMLAQPLVVRQIVDEAGSGATTGTIVRWAVLFIAVAAVTQVLYVLNARVITRNAWRVTNRLRMDLTRHVLGLDHEFHRRHSPGELIQRVDGDVTHVSDFLAQVLPRVFGAIVLVTGMLTVLTVLDWRLGAGMLAYLVIASVVVVVVRQRAVREASDEMSAYAKLYGGIEERLNAVEDLRANGAGDHAMWRFIEESSETLESAVQREAAFLKAWWALHAVYTIGSAGSLVVSAGLVAGGLITLGTAFLLFQYSQQIVRPLEDLIQQLEVVQKASGAMRRVTELMAITPTIHDHGTISPPAGALTVEASGVGFGYSDRPADAGADDRVLVGIDAYIAAGRSVGVVGRTGSGKTTFSRLLLRLVEATEGELRLGGVPIADIPMSELRHRVALVPQEVELFEGTVRDNITLFDDAPSNADVESALRQVGLGALADGGIDRSLGAGGVGLSAGQAQLLALARVWLRQPDLVVLDEATARVDPETEQQIAEAVTRLMVGRTTFVIAHRLSTLDLVDDVMVFDQGRLVEFGSRAELAAREGGRFRRLLSMAGSIDELGDGAELDDGAELGEEVAS